MSVIILLIVISVIVAVFFLGVFIWAVKTGQFDDTISPSIQFLGITRSHLTGKIQYGLNSG